MKKQDATEAAKVEDVPAFDPAAPLPFRIADNRAAIPPYCWVKDPWRSCYYVVRNIVVVFGFLAAAVYFDNWAFWRLY